MRFLPSLGCNQGSAKADVTPHNAVNSADSTGDLAVEDSRLLRTVGWVSAALGAVAIGLIVGRELRQRYKFNRRTPYDLYSHPGDEFRDVDFGVGI